MALLLIRVSLFSDYLFETNQRHRRLEKWQAKESIFLNNHETFSKLIFLSFCILCSDRVFYIEH